MAFRSAFDPSSVSFNLRQRALLRCRTFTLVPLPTIQDTSDDGCGTTSNLPRLTRIPGTDNQSPFSCSRQGGSFG